MVGEIGGDAEERAADYIADSVSKPVVAYIAGFTAPPGKQMGHAGAIISGSSGTAAAKKEALEAKGIRVGREPDRGREDRGRGARRLVSRGLALQLGAGTGGAALLLAGSLGRRRGRLGRLRPLGPRWRGPARRRLRPRRRLPAAELPGGTNGLLRGQVGGPGGDLCPLARPRGRRSGGRSGLPPDRRRARGRWRRPCRARPRRCPRARSCSSPSRRGSGASPAARRRGPRRARRRAARRARPSGRSGRTARGRSRCRRCRRPGARS